MLDSLELSLDFCSGEVSLLSKLDLRLDTL